MKNPYVSKFPGFLEKNPILEKDGVAAEYNFGGFDNKVFGSKYTYVLPQKVELIKEVENLINE
ncbi:MULTISPECIES: hypothetical protein [unclassified Saccharicrinis]|uniref:hypothetical protein n=1 Tax=unclassified Saccharicrinis TaxID=2646859 RepID=UPI003D341942